MIILQADGAIEFSISPHKLLRRNTHVVAAEAERVVDDGVHRHFARGHLAIGNLLRREGFAFALGFDEWQKVHQTNLAKAVAKAT